MRGFLAWPAEYGGEFRRDIEGVDALREVTPPFSPEQVVEQFSSLLRSCNCDKVVGDRYAGEWLRAEYEPSNI